MNQKMHSLLIVNANPSVIDKLIPDFDTHPFAITTATSLPELEATLTKKVDIILADTPTLEKFGEEQFLKLIKPWNPRVFISAQAPISKSIIKLSKRDRFKLLPHPLKPDNIVTAIESTLFTTGFPKSYEGVYRNSIFKSIKEVVEFYIDNDVHISKPQVQPNPIIPGVASALVMVIGNSVFGSIAIALDKEFIFALGQPMFDLESRDELDEELIKEMTNEMANQIIGRARKILSNRLKQDILGCVPIEIGQSPAPTFHPASNFVEQIEVTLNPEKSGWFSKTTPTCYITYSFDTADKLAV